MKQPKATVDQYIDVFDIQDDIIILKDKTLRAILLCSSMNFALKSTEEQNAITYAFQGFLNSLDFFIQIVITTRRLDISDYLKTLEAKQQQEKNELLQIQIAEYSDFIKSLTELGNIMSNNFYLILPFAPVQSKKQGLVGRLETILQSQKKTSFSAELFQQYKNQLWQRIEFVVAGLSGMGIKAAPLNSQDLTELMHNFYNPDKPKKELATPEQLQVGAEIEI